MQIAFKKKAQNSKSKLEQTKNNWPINNAKNKQENQDLKNVIYLPSPNPLLFFIYLFSTPPHLEREQEHNCL